LLSPHVLPDFLPSAIILVLVYRNDGQ